MNTQNFKTLSSRQRQQNVVPDGGWGWFVVLGSFLCHFIIGGMERSSGLLYLYFLERYKESAAATAWATTIASATRLMLGTSLDSRLLITSVQLSDDPSLVVRDIS